MQNKLLLADFIRQTNNVTWTARCGTNNGAEFWPKPRSNKSTAANANPNRMDSIMNAVCTYWLFQALPWSKSLRCCNRTSKAFRKNTRIRKSSTPADRRTDDWMRRKGESKNNVCLMVTHQQSDRHRFSHGNNRKNNDTALQIRRIGQPEAMHHPWNFHAAFLASLHHRCWGNCKGNKHIGWVYMKPSEGNPHLFRTSGFRTMLPSRPFMTRILRHTVASRWAAEAIEQFH